MQKEEKEIKVKLNKNEFDLMEKKVSSFSKLLGEFKQKDDYYDTDNFYILNLNRGLRIRWMEGIPKFLEYKSLFFNTYKISTNNPWYIEEVILTFPLKKKEISTLTKILLRFNIQLKKDSEDRHGYKSIINLLGKSGLLLKFTIDKIRKEYKKKGTIYAFDKIENLGYFLEVEAPDPAKTLQELGIYNFPNFRTGYNDMIAKKIPGYLSNIEKQRRFRSNPRWNILPSEVGFVDKLLKQSLS